MQHVIHIPEAAYSKAAYSYEFYRDVGMDGLFKDGSITDVGQMFINESTYYKANNAMKSNYKRSARTRRMGKERAMVAIAFDWMNYSPVINNDVPDDEIWWYDKEETK